VLPHLLSTISIFVAVEAFLSPKEGLCFFRQRNDMSLYKIIFFILMALNNNQDPNIKSLKGVNYKALETHYVSRV
jgi:hypothetical protein